MAGVSTPALALAVSRAGALGSLATGATHDAATVAQQLAELHAATDRPFNVNVFCHQPAKPDAHHDAQWLAYLRPFFRALGSEPPASLSLGQPGPAQKVRTEKDGSETRFRLPLPAGSPASAAKGQSFRCVLSAGDQAVEQQVTVE